LRAFSHFRPHIHGILPTVLILITAVLALGQATGSSEDASAANPVMKRIERARALAAVHQLETAAVELENIRASSNDVTLRNVATLMLLGIYLEEGNYGRSQSLLEEAFQARAAQKDESIRTYFAAAGQTLNGIRSHLARYRAYGINPSDSDLPAEASADLDRVRPLLERVIVQAKEIAKEEGRSYDALALQDDAADSVVVAARAKDDAARRVELIAGFSGGEALIRAGAVADVDVVLADSSGVIAARAEHAAELALQADGKVDVLLIGDADIAP